MTTNPYIGSSLDDLLEEDGVLEEVDAIARKRVIAWQLGQAMNKKNLTKTEMAKVMKTSRACINRLLDPNNPSVTLLTMERAAAALGMKLKIEFVECNQETSQIENLDPYTALSSNRNEVATSSRKSKNLALV